MISGWFDFKQIRKVFAAQNIFSMSLPAAQAF
jgi:hypothetical protein